MTTEDEGGVVLRCRSTGGMMDGMMDGMMGETLPVEGHAFSLPTVAGASVLKALGSSSVAATN